VKQIKIVIFDLFNIKINCFFASVAIVSIMVPCLCFGGFYKYRDENGVVHFTDNLTHVPENQRPDVKRCKGQGIYNQDRIKKTDRKISTYSEKKPEKENSKIIKTLYKDLFKIKTSLDKEHAKLVAEKKTLLIKKPRRGNRASENAYQQKNKALKERIAAYEKRRIIFQKKVDDYDADMKKNK